MEIKYALVRIDDEGCKVFGFETLEEAYTEMNKMIDAMSQSIIETEGYTPTVKIENCRKKRFIYAEDPIVYWEQSGMKEEADEDVYYIVEIL